MIIFISVFAVITITLSNYTDNTISTISPSTLPHDTQQGIPKTGLHPEVKPRSTTSPSPPTDTLSHRAQETDLPPEVKPRSTTSAAPPSHTISHTHKSQQTDLQSEIKPRSTTSVAPPNNMIPHDEQETNLHPEVKPRSTTSVAPPTNMIPHDEQETNLHPEVEPRSTTISVPLTTGSATDSSKYSINRDDIRNSKIKLKNMIDQASLLLKESSSIWADHGIGTLSYPDDDSIYNDPEYENYEDSDEVPLSRYKRARSNKKNRKKSGRLGGDNVSGKRKDFMDYSNEYFIKRKILKGYDKTTRPVKNDSVGTTVYIGMSLYHILDTVSYVFIH